MLAFDGAAQIKPKQLDTLIDDQNLERQLFDDPETVSELLQRYYKEQGFLAAEVDPPRAEFSGTIARVVVPVREGPRFTVGNVSVAGNDAVATDIILTDLPAVPGEPFLPMAAENALQRIREALLEPRLQRRASGLQVHARPQRGHAWTCDSASRRVCRA